MPAWMKNIDEETAAPESTASSDEAVESSTPAEEAGIPSWLNELDKEEEPAAMPADDGLPAWMQNIEEKEQTPQEPVAAAPEPVQAEPSDVPNWLSELEKEEQTAVTAPADADDLPAWLRGDDSVAETPEPTRATDWKPVETKEPEVTFSPPPAEPERPRIIYSPPLEEETPAPQPEPEVTAPVASVEPEQVMAETPVEQPVLQREEPKPEPQPAKKSPSKPPREPAAPKGVPASAGVDVVLGTARSELSRSNIPGALESYSRLIKKARFLDEVIYDLREALYRYPVEVSIWQSLGDAYMRANRLQDALDAYTKAEELLR
jgi:hypothetical protein